MWHVPCYLVFMNKMDKNNQIEKDVFDTMIIDAIEDLRKSGLEDEEIITIISQEFGTQYLHHITKHPNRQEQDKHELDSKEHDIIQ